MLSLAFPEGFSVRLSHRPIHGDGFMGTAGNRFSIVKETVMPFIRFPGLCVCMMFALGFCLVIPGGSVRADEVIDSIQQAMDSYKKGDFTEAENNLNYASQLIRQKKSSDLEAFLPAPLTGWKAGEVKKQALGQAMFGGMVSVERDYRKGSSRVTVKIVTDSPLVQSMMMMLTNPLLATSDGGTMKKIGGRKAVVKFKDGNQRGEINLIVANRILVTVEGSEVTEKDLADYAYAIDYKKLEALQ